MTSNVNDDDELMLWEELSGSEIELSATDLAVAAHRSTLVAHPQQQWQVYLHTLAVQGVKEWFTEWAADVSVSDIECSIFHPPLASLIDTACNLRVGDMTLCVIASGYLPSPGILISRVALELPGFMPHYYVLMEVAEDDMQVKFYGYLRRDRLLAYARSNAYALDSEWTASLPLQWFDTDIEAFLAEVRCLYPGTLPLQTSDFDADKEANALHASGTLLTSLIPQLTDPGNRWQDILSWEDGISLLAQPPLLNQIYEAQETARRGEASSQVSPSQSVDVESQSVGQSVQTVVNVARWLGDRLDDWATDLAWVLLPPFVPETALRSLGQRLIHLGIDIPSGARRAYQDVLLDRIPMRLHAITWPLSLSRGMPGWSLLVVLSAQADSQLPAGIQLQIRDEQSVLVEQRLTNAVPDGSLYAQVGGYWHELFWITVRMENGISLTLSPLTFAPDPGSAA